MEKTLKSGVISLGVTNEFINPKSWLKDGESIKGAVTVAISKQGITNFCNNGLIDIIKDQVEGLNAPNKAFSQSGFISGLGVYDLCVSVSAGKLSINNLITSSAVQQPNGTFSITISADLSLAYNSWHESYSKIFVSPGTLDPIRQYFDQEFSDFSIKIVGIKLELTIQFTVVANNLEIEVIKSTSTIDPNKIELNFPTRSFLQSRMSCVKKEVKKMVVELISKIDFGSLIKKVANNLFEQIPNSGHLTKDIIYQFPVVGLQFLNNNSMEAGITGMVTYKEEVYPAELPLLPYPNVEEKKDVNFDIHEYEFNALFWAFYKEGDLHMRLTGDMTNDPKEFNTDYYNDIMGLEWMAEKYPNCPIVAYITAIDSPLVSIIPGSLSSIINVDCELKAVQNGTEISLIKVIVNQKDDLTNLTIVTDKNIQKVKFKFTLDNFNATIESSIEPIDPAMFKLIWKMIVEPYYANKMGQVGETGVPLPSMEFFLLGDPEIKLNASYLSLSTNVCKPL
jgi:hypothetical protein